MTDQEVLDRKLADAFGELAKRGFELPITVALVAVNGTCALDRYDGTELVRLVGHQPDDVPNDANALPLNVMFVDRRGFSATMRLGR